MSVKERRDRANAKFVKKSSDVKVNSSSTTKPKNNSGTINSGTSIKQRRDRANNATKTIQPKQEYAVSNSYSHAYKQYVNSPFNMNNIDRTIQDINDIVGYDGKRKEPYRSRVVNWSKPVEEAKQEQVVQQAKPIEQTPVEESITQPTIPINAQDYQLGEYQVDNTVPNSSIGYVMPPIERKSLEMPQSDDSEQISSVRDFLSGVSSIPAYVYHNKVVPFIDETREKLFGPSEEELARRTAEEEQERLRLEEEARIAREQFVQDSIQHDINQRTEDILARIAAMDTSYVVGRYNGRNLVSGLATPGSSRFIGTNRKQKTNVKGYNILAPWNNWSILDENTTAKSIEDNHFIEGNKHQRYGSVDPSVARYITIDEEGNLLFTDTIPRGIRGQITTGYASTGNLSDSFKRNKNIRNIEVFHSDGTKSYPVFSYLNPYNLNSVYHPVQAAILFDLPNGEKSWIIPYGRTANQFYNDVSKIKNITGDDELEFVNFDSRSATGAYGDAGIRYNKFGSYPSLILRRKFGGNIRRSLAKGGRLKARKGYKFSNTAVGRAMQRQYDKEQGIVMQRVIPEIEVFPNYYDLNENGYGNSFAIDKDRRPKTFAQNGETTTPYTPLRLDEQNWLNRTLGINHFAIGLGNFVFNQGNVVPVSKTIQGIETLASMSRGTAPVAIENEVAPKMITYAPKVEQNARLDFLERNPSRISEAERAGVPKVDRNFSGGIHSDNVYGNLRFIRNIDGLPNVDAQGLVHLAKDDKLALANFTTDLPFRLHRSYSKVPGGTYMIVSPRAFKGKRFLSINPSDSFLPSRDAVVSPKFVRIISGDSNVLNEAIAKGMRVSTSDKLKDLYNTGAAVAQKEFDLGLNGGIRDFANFDNAAEELKWHHLLESYPKEGVVTPYRKEVDRIISDIIGRPSIDDYKVLEDITGLKSNVFTSFDDAFLENVSDRLANTNMYRNVYYDATTPAEFEIMQDAGLPTHPWQSADARYFIEKWLREHNISPLKYSNGGSLLKRSFVGTTIGGRIHKKRKSLETI